MIKQYNENEEKDSILLLIKLFATIISKIDKMESIFFESEDIDVSNGFKIDKINTGYKYIINMRP